jgi:sigma-E factor negative regulatory protein RseB
MLISSVMKTGPELSQARSRVPHQLRHQPRRCWGSWLWLPVQARLQSCPAPLALSLIAVFIALSSALTPSLAQALGKADVVDAAHAAVNDSAAMADDPQALLVRMARAQREVEYEGTLVYLHGHHLATLRIAHRIDSGVAMESLLALSGPIRAVARNERGVTCMSSDAYAFSLPRGERGRAILRSGRVDIEHIRGNYVLSALGQSRVAGRDADVVGIAPRDNYRYGYRYYIDRESGLALKIDLIDDAALPIEQVMFTNLEIFPADSAPALLSSAPLDGVPVGDEQVSVVPHSAWTLTAMPPGFEIVASRRDPPMEHLVISDGIASVSVYIEPDAGGLVGAARMGTIAAIGGRINGHHATVVGEVPERTARMLLDGLTPPSTAAAKR